MRKKAADATGAIDPATVLTVVADHWLHVLTVPCMLARLDRASYNGIAPKLERATLAGRRIVAAISSKLLQLPSMRFSHDQWGCLSRKSVLSILEDITDDDTWADPVQDIFEQFAAATGDDCDRGPVLVLRPVTVGGSYFLPPPQATNQAQGQQLWADYRNLALSITSFFQRDPEIDSREFAVFVPVSKDKVLLKHMKAVRRCQRRAKAAALALKLDDMVPAQWDPLDTDAAADIHLPLPPPGQPQPPLQPAPPQQTQSPSGRKQRKGCQLARSQTAV